MTDERIAQLANEHFMDCNQLTRHQFINFARAILAEAVPEGWKLVPVWPTVAQLDTAVAFALNVKLSEGYMWSDYMRDVYQRMLAAAPSPDVQPAPTFTENEMEKMTRKEALAVVGRYAPCPHDNANTDIGNGKVWAKCDDCGTTFAQEDWPKARDAAQRFDDAIMRLNAEVNGGRLADRPSEAV